MIFRAPLLLAVPLSLSVNAQIDLDGDGISDAWTTHYAAQGLSPMADTDGDGMSNRAEATAGTNPFSADSRLQLAIRKETLQSQKLNWPSIKGKAYQIHHSSDLQNWSPHGDPIMGTGAQLDLSQLQNGNRGFFRLAVYDVDVDGDGLSAYEEALFGFSDSLSNSLPGTGRTDFGEAVARIGAAESFQLGGKTVAGTPPPLEESSRFLQQATMGSTYSVIESVSTTGIPAWIEDQFAIPATSHVLTNNALALTFEDEDIPGELITTSDYRWTWWNTAMTAPDVLRQRVAFALSEIFVISQTTDELEDFYWGIATYYDILVNNAFGNYRDLLYQISTNPAMGHYLSHVKNRPTDATNNLFPDENYAREVMQLFSIGLYELNPDGSRKKDINGNDIPTYDNTDITNFAKVFTGLTYNPTNPDNGTPYFNELEFSSINNSQDYLAAQAEWMGIEMTFYEPMHEIGAKHLLYGEMTNGTLEQDLNTAIDNLFQHPNTGPFIGRLLIQRLVTSNPSPEYIRRVATAFDNNGSGVRGDMKAVIRAILLDPEARNRSKLNDPNFGKLREPVMRHTHIARAFNYSKASGPFRVEAIDGGEAYAQQPMRAPSVFNFYLPDHQPLGPIKDAGLVAPEFQITTATTTIKNLNFYSLAIPCDFLLLDTHEEDEILNDYSAEIALLENNDVAGLLNRLDLLLTRGQMTNSTRTALTTAITGAMSSGADTEQVVRFAVTLIASSPDFAILR